MGRIKASDLKNLKLEMELWLRAKRYIPASAPKKIKKKWWQRKPKKEEDKYEPQTILRIRNDD